MKKIKILNGWGIYQNNQKETEEYGFKITILQPDNMEYAYMCDPSDTDMEFDEAERAIEWIENYNK